MKRTRACPLTRSCTGLQTGAKDIKKVWAQMSVSDALEACPLWSMPPPVHQHEPHTDGHGEPSVRHDTWEEDGWTRDPGCAYGVRGGRFQLVPGVPSRCKAERRQGRGGQGCTLCPCVCVCLCLQTHRMCVSVVFGILLCEASHARCTRCGRAGVLSLAKEAALDASIVTPFTSLVFVVNSTGSGLRCNSSATGAASAPPRPYTHACVHTLCSSLCNTSATGVALRWLLASSRVRAYPC